MSTRKIEGYLTAHDDNGPGYELGNGAGFGSFWEGDPTKFLPDALPVTLIIDGKGYIESEVMAMAREVLLLCNELGAIDRYKAREVFEKYRIINP